MKMTTTLLFSALTLGAITLTAQSSPFAGNGTFGNSGDGGPATSAALNLVAHTTSDALGNFYISDIGNNNIRKVNTSGIINTHVGNSTAGFSGDGGLATAAMLNGNLTNKLDASGNLYVIDQNGSRIRKITASGIITTIAGISNSTSGYTGNSGDGGLATVAEISAYDMAIDASGNIYICQANDNVIRKINTSGVITKFAGTGLAGFSGDGGLATSAKLNRPTSLATDNVGNVFVLDEYNTRIRKVTASGIISTYAGNGNFGYSGDGGNAILADVIFSQGGWPNLLGGRMAFNTSNELCFIAFSTTYKINIRKINSLGVISTALDSTNFTSLGTDLVYIHIDNANNLYFTSAGNVCGISCIPGSPLLKVSLNPASTTGVEALDFDNKLAMVYPIPSNGAFTVETKLLNNASVDVYDMAGKLVHTQVLTDAKNNINLDLPAGNYNVSVKGNGVTINKNIIIAK